MKRWIYPIVTAMILLLLCGCAKEETVYTKPVNVYFYNNQAVYDAQDSVLVPETRELSGSENDLRGFLNNYILQGPDSDELSSPFPPGGWILKFDHSSLQANVQLSVHFFHLSGREQTLACTCLSKTIFELTDCDRVRLQMIGDETSEVFFITITRDNLLLMDNTPTN